MTLTKHELDDYRDLRTRGIECLRFLAEGASAEHRRVADHVDRLDRLIADHETADG